MRTDSQADYTNGLDECVGRLQQRLYSARTLKIFIYYPPPPPKKKNIYIYILDAYWKPRQAIDATYKQVENSGFKKYKKP